MESITLQIVLYAATTALGAIITKLIDWHRAKREDQHLDKENENLDKDNDAKTITNIDAAVDTWQKVVNALEGQVSKLLEQRQEDSRQIIELSNEVGSLRQQVYQLQNRLASQAHYQQKIERYEKLLAEHGIAY